MKPATKTHHLILSISVASVCCDGGAAGPSERLHPHRHLVQAASVNWLLVAESFGARTGVDAVQLSCHKRANGQNGGFPHCRAHSAARGHRSRVAVAMQPETKGNEQA